MTRDGCLASSLAWETAVGLLSQCTPAVPALPPPAGYALAPVGARRVTAGRPTQQITVLGSRPTGRRDHEGAV